MKNTLQAKIDEAMASGNYDEMAILVDTREAWAAEQQKPVSRRRSFAAVEQGIRDVYAGNNPYLAGPVTVEVL